MIRIKLSGNNYMLRLTLMCTRDRYDRLFVAPTSTQCIGAVIEQECTQHAGLQDVD